MIFKILSLVSDSPLWGTPESIAYLMTLRAQVGFNEMLKKFRNHLLTSYKVGDFFASKSEMPSVIILYAWGKAPLEDRFIKAWVEMLQLDLKSLGFRVIRDMTDSSLGDDHPKWTEEQISDADFVVFANTKRFKIQAEQSTHYTLHKEVDFVKVQVANGTRDRKTVLQLLCLNSIRDAMIHLEVMEDVDRAVLLPHPQIYGHFIGDDYLSSFPFLLEALLRGDYTTHDFQATGFWQQAGEIFSESQYPAGKETLTPEDVAYLRTLKMQSLGELYTRSAKRLGRPRSFSFNASSRRTNIYVERPWLDNQLQSALDKPDCVVMVNGFPGSGKTQLVIRNMTAFYKRFSMVVWINGKDRDSIENDFRSFAEHHFYLSRRISFDQVVSNVYEELRMADGAYLFIFDNVTKLDEVKELMPPMCSGGSEDLGHRVIITSYRTPIKGQSIGRLRVASPIVLEEFSTEEAKHFFRQYNESLDVTDADLVKLRKVAGSLRPIVISRTCKFLEFRAENGEFGLDDVIAHIQIQSTDSKSALIESREGIYDRPVLILEHGILAALRASEKEVDLIVNLLPFMPSEEPILVSFFDRVPLYKRLIARLNSSSLIHYKDVLGKWIVVPESIHFELRQSIKAVDPSFLESLIDMALGHFTFDRDHLGDTWDQSRSFYTVIHSILNQEVFNEIPEDVSLRKKMACLFFRMADYYYFQEDYVQSSAHCDTAIDLIGPSMDPNLLGQVFHLQGNILDKEGCYSEAKAKYSEAVETFPEESDSKHFKIRALHCWGNMLSKMSVRLHDTLADAKPEFDEALTKYSEASSLYDSLFLDKPDLHRQHMGLLLHELGTIHFRLAFKFNTDADTLANLIEAEKHLEDCIKLKQSCYEDHHHFIAISRRKLARIKLALFRRDSVTYADRLAQADILSGQAFDVFDALSPTQKKRSIELAHCLLLRAEFYQLSGDPRREDAVSLARSKYVNKFGMAHDKLSNFDHYARQVGLISAE